MTDYKRLPYEAVCSLVQDRVWPLAKPSGSVLRMLYDALDRNRPYHNELENELELVGAFVFIQAEQDGYMSISDGVTLDIMMPGTDKRAAVIGLSRELLTVEPKSYQDFLVLHEFAHLAVMNHNEDFSRRFMSLLWNWANVNTRMDSHTARRHDRYPKHRQQASRRAAQDATLTRAAVNHQRAQAAARRFWTARGE